MAVFPESRRPQFFLSDFQTVLPRFRVGQEASLQWLAQAHALGAEATSGDPATESALLLKLAKRFGCGPEKIEGRFHEPPDFQGVPTRESLVFSPLSRRMDFYTESVNRVFGEFYPDALTREQAPAELIHVSCTGYRSPSAAQTRVAKLGWGDRTRVTHAYHMGCYAAVPALRLAQGALLRTAYEGLDSQTRVDVAHTEICSLHFRPGIAAPDQWVIQSLFADGFIRYSMQLQEREKSAAVAGFRLLGTDEVLVPDTADEMTWVPTEEGFAMTLGREVPRAIGRTVRTFVERLLAQHGFELERDRSRLYFAVHPGGPRIVDAVEEALALRSIQTAHARQVLRERGNLSSATLPHIWQKMLGDREIPSGTPIVSLAFGPGLTVCGSLFVLERAAETAR